MGEQKEEKTGEKKEKKGGGEKKEDGPVPVVIKVDMHCEGCARKVKKSVKDLPGVEEVKVDLAGNKLTVIGKVDPKTVCERVQKKCQKKIELVSPLPKKDEGEKKEQKPAEKEKEKEKKPEEKKEKEPTVITTVMKVTLHCEACAHNVQKAIVKFKGVQTADLDMKNSTFTVKGTMDPNKLAEYVHKKTKKYVEIVPPKKEGDKKDDKKEDKKEGSGGGKKKDGGDKKDEENKKKGDDDKKADESKGDGEESKGEGKKNEVPIPRYVIEYVHPPQIFSDENPNACSVM